MMCQSMFRAVTLSATLLLAYGLALPIYAVDGAERPNVMIIIGDDASRNDLPLYGGANADTPNIDGLAKQGMTFDRAYLSIAMCMPCRAELYTGLYPVRSGVCWNHSAARPGTKSIVHHLGDLGYRVGISGKGHFKPRESFPFEKVQGVEPGAIRKTANFDYPEKLTEYMTRDGKPFCLVVGLVVPHTPWTVGDDARFDRGRLELPPYMIDTPVTRDDFAKYLAEVEVMDEHVGLVLDALTKSGKAGNTIVIFTSEQGGQWPGGKWTNYDMGIHTGFVVRWPGKVAADKRTDALVQYADVVPTLIEAAGGEVAPDAFDGTSFLGVLLGKDKIHRDYAYSMHNNVPEGPPYPIRGVTDGRYHYLRNLKHENAYFEKHLMQQKFWHAYWPSWEAQAQAGDPHAKRILDRYIHRPAEELYDLKQDPHELNNLADDPEFASIKARLSAEVDRWMQSQGDPGAEIDSMEQLEAARRGEHFQPVR